MDRIRNWLYVTMKDSNGAVGAIQRYDDKLNLLLRFRGGIARSGPTLGAVDAEGNLFAGGLTLDAYSESAGRKGEMFSHLIGGVMVFGMDGKIKQRDQFKTCAVPGALARDSKGNLYATDLPVADLKLGSHDMPGVPWKRGDRPLKVQSDFTVLVKFPPQGGARRTETELWAHRGVSPVNGGRCWCSVNSNCLAVDEADRIFATDYLRYHLHFAKKP
jgi:hypothetical protein